MNKIALFALSLFAVTAIGFGLQLNKVEAQAAEAGQTCDVAVVDGPSNNGIKISADGKTASSTLNVTGNNSNCNRYATLSVWKAPNNTTGRPFSEQKFFGYKTVHINKTGRYTITAKLPECTYWQVDLLGQKRPKSINGDANYQYPQDILVNYKLGGAPCTPPPPPPPPPPVQNNKDISITKAASVTKAKVGEIFTYTINVKNIGNVKLTNVRITDTLPAGIIAVDKPNDREISFEIAELNVGETKDFSFQAKVVDTVQLDTVLKNVACVVTTELPEKECDDADVTVSKVTTPVVTPPNTVVQPPAQQLPKTGPVATIAAISGTGFMAGAVRLYASSRRDLLTSLLIRK